MGEFPLSVSIPDIRQPISESCLQRRVRFPIYTIIPELRICSHKSQYWPDHKEHRQPKNEQSLGIIWISWTTYTNQYESTHRTTRPVRRKFVVLEFSKLRQPIQQGLWSHVYFGIIDIRNSGFREVESNSHPCHSSFDVSGQSTTDHHLTVYHLNSVSDIGRFFIPSIASSTISPTGAVASSSARALQSSIAVIMPNIQSYVDNPGDDTSTKAINAIKGVLPIAKVLPPKLFTVFRKLSFSNL